MRLAELLTTAGKLPLTQFGWGPSLIELINSRLPTSASRFSPDLPANEILGRLSTVMSTAEAITLMAQEVSIQPNGQVTAAAALNWPQNTSWPPQGPNGWQQPPTPPSVNPPTPPPTVSPTPVTGDGTRISITVLIIAGAILLATLILAITQITRSAIYSGNPVITPSAQENARGLAEIAGDIARGYSQGTQPADGTEEPNGATNDTVDPRDPSASQETSPDARSSDTPPPEEEVIPSGPSYD